MTVLHVETRALTSFIIIICVNTKKQTKQKKPSISKLKILYILGLYKKALFREMGQQCKAVLQL